MLSDNPQIFFETERLRVRAYVEADKAFMREMQCDPDWMKNFPFTRTPEEADGLVDKYMAEIDKEGFSFFALEDKETGEFVGYCGLHVPDWNPPFGECVEIGWGIRKKFMGFGLVSEAAKGCFDFAKSLGLKEIYSFTTAGNASSIAVMERTGMARVKGGDFLHPKIDPESPFALHVLYKISF